METFGCIVLIFVALFWVFFILGIVFWIICFIITQAVQRWTGIDPRIL